jgi:hypothetical protein
MSDPIEARLLREAIQARTMAGGGSAASADLAQLFEDAIAAIRSANEETARWKKACFDFAEWVGAHGGTKT